MLLWLLFCLALLFKVLQRTGTCCCSRIVYHYCVVLTEEWFIFGCYFVYHYCLRFDRGVVHFFLLFCLPLLFKILQRSGWCCCCYIFYHYCLRFDRREVHILVVILSTITVWCLTEEWFVLWWWLYCIPLLFNVW